MNQNDHILFTDFCHKNKPFSKIPLIPAIRPLKRRRAKDAIPIRIPPKTAEIGVKFSIDTSKLIPIYWIINPLSRILF
jgi:hypothetical protein